MKKNGSTPGTQMRLTHQRTDDNSPDINKYLRMMVAKDKLGKDFKMFLGQTPA